MVAETLRDECALRVEHVAVEAVARLKGEESGVFKDYALDDGVGYLVGDGGDAARFAGGHFVGDFDFLLSGKRRVSASTCASR